MTAQTVAVLLIALLVALGLPGGPSPLPPEDPAPSVADSGDFSAENFDDGGDAPPLYVLGYYMQDRFGDGRNSLSAHADVVDGVAPWGWGLTKEGGLRPVYFRESHLAELLAWAGGRGVETHVLVHNFDPDLGAFDPDLADVVLTDGRIRARAVEAIAATAVGWGVDGVHIDFEGVRAERRDDLIAFVAELRRALERADVALSIAAPAITFATEDRPWVAAYDYGALARHVDFIAVMAYDQHWPGGPAGPVAALPWVRDVVEYATAADGGGVPPQQIVLGVAGYGYDWPAGGSGGAVTWAETAGRIEAAHRLDGGAAPRWHGDYASPYFDYGDGQIWFEDARSLSHKLALARQFGLRGVALWRLGQEDPELWPLLREFN